jgi:integrase
MAFIEQRGKWLRIIFKYQGKRYTHSLHSPDGRTAQAIKGGVEKTILQLQQRLLTIPAGADVKDFILTGGQTVVRPAGAPAAVEEELTPPPEEPLTLARLTEQYTQTMAIGAIEDSSLETIRMHLRHFERTLGADCPLEELTLTKLQGHINKRAGEKGIRKKPLSPTTIKKEVASLRAAWNWGVQAGLLAAAFPSKGLKYPKTSEKPPFQTWQEIERQIAQGGLDEAGALELWDCLFLGLEEIEELLRYVQEHAVQPWVYPMFCFAAHTGARRSEMIRARRVDLDLDHGTFRIQEKKRSHSRRTSRRVPLSGFLAQVLGDWLRIHPGGPFLFAQSDHVFRSKKNRDAATAVTRDEAHDHFKRTLAGGRWRVLRGWHVLRHSFASNCALRGVDRGLINSWLGHQTKEMVQRYRHLFPHQEKRAIQLVFGRQAEVNQP